MKLKSYLAIIPIFFAFAFAACDDDLNDVGGSVQPPSDGISVTINTIATGARTISVGDSVYARALNGVLGVYEDKVFGSVKADYLAQFYFPQGAKFEENVVEIDSVQFVIDFVNFTGDTLAPMGLAVYEANKPLTENFYTNVNPSDYTDLSKVLAERAFTISGTPIRGRSAEGNHRALIADLGKSFGERIYDAYQKKTIFDNESFNKFFKGVYVTTNFGSTTMINVKFTSIDIYYKYNDVNGNFNNTRDTIRTSRFSLAYTNEVIQLNHIQNTNPSELFVQGTGSTYLKTPAGVYTEIDFPIEQIKDDMSDLRMNTIISAQFFVNGNTQLENNTSPGIERPANLLLIDKDSIDAFFTGRNKPTNIGSFATPRNAANNTYNFLNIAGMLNHYKERGVKKATFVLIPVEVRIDPLTGEPLGVYNYLRPSTAILRSDSTNMKLNLIYSRFNGSDS